jgi:crotonobetainyl-CoA:carnitine CoA-transferase CaiB-like acyl-CoA transferase
LTAAALSDVTVLDFGRYIAGPWCAALLGDLGADVIRVERTGGAEDRQVGALVGDSDAGPLFLQVNRNKRSVAFDVASDLGREVVRRLVAQADVVVANLPGATLRSLGLDYPTLRAVKSDIVLTTASAFGSGGPYEERVGFDGVAQAMSGAVYMTGQPGSPTKSYVPWVDFLTATTAAYGTLAALHHRDRTGEGQHVEAALLRSAALVASGAVIEQGVMRSDRGPIGNRSHSAAPYDVFRTLDGWVIVHVIGEAQFARCARLVGREDWLSDPRFATDGLRAENSDELCDVVAEWTAGRSSDEVLGLLEKARIPAGPVYTPQELLDDPHVDAAGYLQGVGYPGLAVDAPLGTTPVRLSSTPGSVRSRAPLAGEHTESVLSGLGFSPAEIAAVTGG